MSSSIQEIILVDVSWDIISAFLNVLTQNWEQPCPDSLLRLVLRPTLPDGDEHTMNNGNRPAECLDFFKRFRGAGSQLHFLQATECVVRYYIWDYEILGVNVEAVQCFQCHWVKLFRAQQWKSNLFLAALQEVPIPDPEEETGSDEGSIDEGLNEAIADPV